MFCIPTTLQTHIDIDDHQQEAGLSVVFPNQSDPGRGQQASLELGTEAGPGSGGGATDWRGVQQTILLNFTTLVILYFVKM